MLYSKTPEKLLRIPISNKCNYECTFCCWNHKPFNPIKLLNPNDYNILVQAANMTGCTRIMLTGGEPLQVTSNNTKELFDIIKSISSVKGLTDFWLLTNGFYLNSSKLISDLKQAGLKKVVVSIGAESNKKYKEYSQTEYDLDTILNNITLAIRGGMHLKVDVPLSRSGIKNYDELLVLIKKLEYLGVPEVAYFKLHKTAENIEVYDSLFVDVESITEAFNESELWDLNEDEGKLSFSNGKISVIIPAAIEYRTTNCDENSCGPYCQGIYAAYLVSEEDKTFIRACHHEFKDKRNEYIIGNCKGLFAKEKIIKIFRDVWIYAYGENDIIL